MEQTVQEPAKTAAEAESFAEYKALRKAETEPPAEPKPEPKKEEPPVEPPKEETPSEPAKAGESAEDTETSDKQEHKPRRDRTAEGRIAELTAARHKAEEEAADLRKQLELARAPRPAERTAEPTKAAPATEADPKPKLRDFLDKPDVSYEDAQEQWEEAVAGWRDRKRQAEQQKQEVVRTLTQRVNAARQEMPDFDSVAANLSLTPTMQDFAREEENGMKVIYHLGKNPEVYHNILGLSPVRQAAALALLGASLNPPASAPAKPSPPVSRAPAPPRIVSGTESSAPRDLSEVTDFAEYKRLRKGQR